jgi:ABC-type multidrug transport system fused ATPase/permease subunit
MRGMFRLISKHNRRLVAAILLNTLLGLGALAPPFLLKVIVDELIKVTRNQGAVEIRVIVWSLVGLGVLRVGMAATGYFQEKLSDVLRLDIIMELRGQLFAHVLELSVDYYETHKVGEIVQRITQAVYEFGVWLQDVSQTVLLRVLTIVFSVVVIWWVNPLAGLVVTVTVVAKLAVALRKKHQTRALRRRVREHVEVVHGRITESVQNLTTLRAFGGEPGARRAFDKEAADMRKVRLAQHTVEWRYNAVVELIEGAGMVLAFAAVAFSAFGGNASPGDVVLVALYLQQVMANLRPMATFIDNTGELISSCERMLDLLAVEPTVRDRPDARVLERLERIEFRGVGFEYPGHKESVLRDISFELEPGQMLALVGPSGTGKTTIVKLLLRLYDPTSGQILVNGEDVTAFTAESLRRHIGTVMQDVALFNDTFTANVQLGKPDATRTEVERAVKLSHAEEFVQRLPNGYETLVGERGIKLSGGQKQRVAIARAILKEPSLVILDEATSALDSVSEREVQAGLNELTQGRMAVVIAHRLSTIKKADHILVIKQGKISERGSHEDLVEGRGLYAQLFKMQSK